MVNIKGRKRNKIGEQRFFIENIAIPLLSPIIAVMILPLFLSKENLLALIEKVPSVGPGLCNLVRIVPGLYGLAAYLCFYYLFGVVTNRLFARTQLLPDNHYFLVPTWMIKFASFVSHLHSGNASTIPIWQYAQYLFYRSTFSWGHLTLLVPEVSSVDEETEVDRNVGRDMRVSKRKHDRALIVADTYPVDLDQLPNLLDEMSYVVLETLSSGHRNRVRGYNPRLVNAMVNEVRRAESDGIHNLYLLLNTNPKHVTELFREAFNDAGRNSLIHLYVFQSGGVKGYRFTKPHRIF
ncbi:hypothetical protein KG087_09765 [Lacticaseibacillus zeae]|uniref:hypothetical protein n=1 Tax=Lacticaseibacillus zeae TaxID=57037 RepID=UPI001BCD0BEE|nr:hypothetical protein [Lacticaseibacillus zeae]QVI31207.1 hypothetical protein KG087_09765 [Lacticaseibacillus zeae]